MTLHKKTKEKLIKVKRDLLSDDTLTYNEAAIRNQTSPSTAKKAHEYLVDIDRIESRALKVHLKTAANGLRKKRTTVNNALFLETANLFLQNTNKNIVEVANMSKLSFGACYRIHDFLVSNGKIENRRTHVKKLYFV